MNSVIKLLELQSICVNRDNTTAYVILNTDNVRELYRIFYDDDQVRNYLYHKRKLFSIRRYLSNDIDTAIVFDIIEIDNSTYMYPKYIYNSLTFRYSPSECTDTKSFIGDLINKNIIFLYSFNADKNIIKINTCIHPELADKEAKIKPLNNEQASKNSITKKVTVSKLSKIRTNDTDYEDIINKLYKIVGELSCRETSGNCNSSNGWSDLCNAGIKLFNKLK